MEKTKQTTQKKLLYNIDQRIGAGAFSNVYIANDFSGKQIAVKIIRDITSSDYSLIKTYRELKIMHNLTKMNFLYSPKLYGAELKAVPRQKEDI